MRELENVVERAVVLATEPYVVRHDLLLGTHLAPEALPAKVLEVLPADGLDLDVWLGEREQSLLLQALERTGGNRTNAAKLLRMSLRSLRYRLAKYGLGEDTVLLGGDDADDG